MLYVGHSDKLRLFKNCCTLLNQPSTFRNELCMLVAYLSYCLLIVILFFMDGELVKELTLAVQINKHEKAAKIVEEKLPHNSEAFQDNLLQPELGR